MAGTPARSATYRVDDKPTSVGLNGQLPDILGYDALDRLASVQVGNGGAVTQLVWNGDELAGELDNTGALQIMYAHDQGNDAPVVMRNVPGHYNLVFHTDERGSVVAVSGSMVAYNDLPGTVQRIHTYDAYGREGSAPHLGRFGYAGGVALPEAGLVHMRARAYDPALGRFLSADPIGVAGGINLYGYAGGDPIDFIDPSGLAGDCSASGGEILVCNNPPSSGGLDITGNTGSVGFGGGVRPEVPEDVNGDPIVVRGKRPHSPGVSVTPIRVGPPLTLRPTPQGPSSNDDDNDREQKKDENICRRFSGALASACYQSALARDYARRNGRPLPPLTTSLFSGHTVGPRAIGVGLGVGAVALGIILAPEITIPALIIAEISQ